MSWKSINSYEQSYEINDEGKIRSITRLTLTIKGTYKLVKGRILIPKLHNNGYLFITLSKNGQTKNYYIHRLVAEAFIPNPEFKPIVNHINGIKSDNTLENLEWVTISENVNHAYAIGLSTNIGSTHKNAKTITDSCSGKQYHSIKEASEQLSINYSSLRNMLCGANRNTTCLQYSC